MDIYEKDSATVAMTDTREQLKCVVSGQINIFMATGWQRFQVKAGLPFMEGDATKKNQSPLDLKNGLQDSRVHEMILDKGDCVFIPAYWWTQVVLPEELPGDGAVVVTHYYDVASTWL